LQATADMQLSADSNNINNTSFFNDKPSSTFQLVVASVNLMSKAVLNNHSKPYVSKESKAKYNPHSS
jgi:hypothetical protein